MTTTSMTIITTMTSMSIIITITTTTMTTSMSIITITVLTAPAAATTMTTSIIITTLTRCLRAGAQRLPRPYTRGDKALLSKLFPTRRSTAWYSVQRASLPARTASGYTSIMFPALPDVRHGSAATTGRLCVIGSKLEEACQSCSA